MNENKGKNIDIYCLINILGFAIQKKDFEGYRATMKS